MIMTLIRPYQPLVRLELSLNVSNAWIKTASGGSWSSLGDPDVSKLSMVYRSRG